MSTESVGGRMDSRARRTMRLIGYNIAVHRRYAGAVRRVAAAEDAPLVDLHREFDHCSNGNSTASFGKTAST